MMAECLHCGSHAARVIESRSIRLGTGERQNWRTVVCPPLPYGCGQRRRQVVVDGGEAVKRWIARTKLLRVGVKP